MDRLTETVSEHWAGLSRAKKRKAMLTRSTCVSSSSGEAESDHSLQGGEQLMSY